MCIRDRYNDSGHCTTYVGHNIQKHTAGPGPVSYTHLDVYKRQGYTAPCGVGRQVMMEFCNPKTFKIILAIDRENYRVYTLEDMLPQGFGPANLE